MHIVVKKGSGIKSVADLKGKRVSLDEPGSGTLVNARAILAAYGVTEKDIRPEYLKQQQCAEKLKDGSLDAYFQTTGYPQGTLSELAATNGFELLPIDGAERDKIMAQYKFFAKDKIPAGVYKDVKGVKTIAVGAQWRHLQAARRSRLRDHQGAVERQDARRARCRPRQGQGDPEGDGAAGVGIPLHAGAEKFYKEAGLLK